MCLLFVQVLSQANLVPFQLLPFWYLLAIVFLASVFRCVFIQHLMFPGGLVSVGQVTYCD